MFIVPSEVIASYERLSYFRVAAVNRENGRKPEKGGVTKGICLQNNGRNFGACIKAKDIYRMRLHSKKDPQVNDRGGSVDPKLEKQLNLKTGRGSESERGCQEAGPHGWPPCRLRCRVLLWSVLRKEPSLTVNLGLTVGKAAGNILPSALEVGGEAAGKRSWHLPSADSLDKWLCKFFKGGS